MLETLVILLIIIAIINIFLTLKKTDNNPNLDNTEERIKGDLQRNRIELNDISQKNREELLKTITEFEQKLTTNLDKKFDNFNSSQDKSYKDSKESILNIEKNIEKQLKEIRTTVDEKLQTTLEKRLGESFKQVSERLELVHKGLGEMQNIATGVGDLKKVLSNVKTRGILGEYQLEAILEQILAPGQYAKNVATKKGSQANVEFAIKLPGYETDKEVWIPVDSKFPIEGYSRLLDALDIGDIKLIESSQKELLKTIENFAKDISEKYIDPPHTTDFAVMFLPIEGIYAEVLRHPELFAKLQNKYKITITGPTTLSAFLSSLQMGFRTLAVQKRSSEVWNVLKVVKSEFEVFSGVFAKVQKQLDTASNTLNTLQTTRISVMNRKLKGVESIDTTQKIEEVSIDLEHK